MKLLAAYEQALRLQRKRERTIETYCKYLWKVAKHFNRCPDDPGLIQSFNLGSVPAAA